MGRKRTAGGAADSAAPAASADAGGGAAAQEAGLFPAALVHFASLVTKAEPVQYLSSTSLASLSNLTGANMVASQARRRSTAVGQQASSASFDFR